TTKENEERVRAYVKQASLKSDLDRTDLAKEKTGVFSGSYAINPVNNKRIPVWIADYVLTAYGTGAIMAVPAHDERDFEFAGKFGLPIECIMSPDTDDPGLKEKIIRGKACWTEDGTYINSSDTGTGLDINGLRKEEGINKTISWLEKNKLGEARVNYKLRDWLFSRQRYWGEPFPVVHWEDGTISVLEESDLPLELPVLEKYQPGENGESPLASATEWLTLVRDDGVKGRRETNTMPQWAGSCWYYLRFIDPHNEKAILDKEKEKYWMPVDLYVGGAEHAVLHLLYSRFWHKVLYDMDLVSHDEPYLKLFNQGMILAFAYETETGAKVPADMVEEKDGKFFNRKTGEELTQIVAKMSKSLKNVVNPDDIIDKYGADSLRLYEMFMGPLDASKPWDEKGVKGVFGFLARVSRLFGDLSKITDKKDSPPISKALHQTIRKVESDIENLRFNTAISALMIFTNQAIKQSGVNKETAGTFAKILHPFAPHLAEELWQLYGNNESLAYENWPEVNELYLKEDTFEYPVSFNGKLRFKLELPLAMQYEEMEEVVIADERSQRWLQGKKPRKIIIVKGRIINVVI
ncbi:MAG: leucine--tRNA ligase, partial [Bacteroidales bacterium]|nr:leucine--tRNA ligase [Bacteroidales bacterium]